MGLQESIYICYWCCGQLLRGELRDDGEEVCVKLVK
jgi:hypothetical protein